MSTHVAKSLYFPALMWGGSQENRKMNYWDLIIYVYIPQISTKSWWLKIRVEVFDKIPNIMNVYISSLLYHNFGHRTDSIFIALRFMCVCVCVCDGNGMFGGQDRGGSRKFLRVVLLVVKPTCRVSGVPKGGLGACPPRKFLEICMLWGAIWRILE